VEYDEEFTNTLERFAEKRGVEAEHLGEESGA
jgi:ActR/RegA family two-component response regulator